ncbi:MAG: prenyltransferase/squalene oxidase repeat-containing protein [Zavarzinella sp.]
MRKTCLTIWCICLVPIIARADDWTTTVNGGIEFLRKSQNANGSWGTEPRSRGVTGIVVTGLLSTGSVTVDDPMVAKALKYIVNLTNAKEGHLAGNDAVIQLHNYVTSVNVMALKKANQPDKYQKIIDDAVKFLKGLQWNEGEGKKPTDDFFGGAGYDSKSRPDLSNTQFFIEALREAGVPSDDPSLLQALIFVSRCQNLKSEFNTMPWAGKINDGSFIYSAAGGGQTKTSDTPGGDLTGYGSMTYAGIKSMIYCGVSKKDPRYLKAAEWIAKNYTVDANPGMPPALSQRGLYYYYHTMSKALALMETDVVVDDKGVKHEWKKELLTALKKRQKMDGSWINETDRWMEGDPALVTGYVLMTLSQLK